MAGGRRVLGGGRQGWHLLERGHVLLFATKDLELLDGVLIEELRDNRPRATEEEGCVDQVGAVHCLGVVVRAAPPQHSRAREQRPIREHARASTNT